MNIQIVGADVTRLTFNRSGISPKVDQSLLTSAPRKVS
jgi:hypothetical protein